MDFHWFYIILYNFICILCDFMRFYVIFIWKLSEAHQSHTVSMRWYFRDHFSNNICFSLKETCLPYRNQTPKCYMLGLCTLGIGSRVFCILGPGQENLLDRKFGRWDVPNFTLFKCLLQGTYFQQMCWFSVSNNVL